MCGFFLVVGIRALCIFFNRLLLILKSLHKLFVFDLKLSFERLIDFEDTVKRRVQLRESNSLILGVREVDQLKDLIK